MRTRMIALMIGLLMLAAAAGASGVGGAVAARLQADATPVAGTPEAVESGTPVADETVSVVTLVAWYSPSDDGETLELGPIRTNNRAVASANTSNPDGATGSVNFEEEGNDFFPRIRLGDSTLDATLPFDDPDLVFRWIYINDDPGARPATLVLEVKAVGGPYEGYTGTATFVSRALDAGGVLVIVLNPPA